MKLLPISNHLVFTGNPGTGKTTVARLLAQIYKESGLLKKGHLVEVSRDDLVAHYVGQTATKTNDVIKKAMGGVLFIDEAYTLVPKNAGNDFGQEAIDTLLKAMEDLRDEFIVIVAGYKDDMNRFIESNDGLKSRFNKYIEFSDYTPSQLTDLFKLFVKNGEYKLDKDCDLILYETFKDIYDHRETGFANGRTVRNFFEDVVTQQINRTAYINEIRDEDLIFIKKEDILKAIQKKR